MFSRLLCASFICLLLYVIFLSGHRRQIPIDASQYVCGGCYGSHSEAVKDLSHLKIGVMAFSIAPVTILLQNYVSAAFPLLFNKRVHMLLHLLQWLSQIAFDQTDVMRL